MNNENLLIGNRASEPTEQGRLATSLSENNEALRPMRKISELQNEIHDVIIYAQRNQSLLPESVEYCQEHGVPLINLTSGNTPPLPENPNFLYLSCPNIALEVIDTMAEIQHTCEIIDRPFTLAITEHHQSSKEDISKTARAISDAASTIINCSNITGDYRHILPVRNLPTTQKRFEVPPKNEGGYAIHEVRLLSQHYREIIHEFEPIEVYGREAYNEGLSWVIATINQIESITGPLSINEFRSRYT